MSSSPTSHTARAGVPPIDALLRLVGPDRLSSYGLPSHDRAYAVQLYLWNLELSSAIFRDIAIGEVVIRNACHDQLTARCLSTIGTPEWYEHLPLSDRDQREVAQAKVRITRARRVVTPGRIVAELTLGFWRYLHSARHESTLWTPSLRHAYPFMSPQHRADVASRLDDLNLLRNRIAHHEPIHALEIGDSNLDVVGVHGELLEVLNWIDPAVSNWLKSWSRVPTVLATRPKD